MSLGIRRCLDGGDHGAQDDFLHAAAPREVIDGSGEALKERPRTDRAVELNNRISELLFGIMGVVEAYPELKANENFLQLQRALNEVEEQISAARRAYNAAVMDLNNAVQMFPSSIVASATGFGTRRFFEAAGAERAVPQVRGLGGDPAEGAGP